MRKALAAALAALVAACAPAPLAPAAGVTLAVDVALPFAVQGVHRWVGADVTAYDVTLKVRNAQGGYEDLDPAVAVHLPTSGAEAKTRAVFAHMAPGKAYRAFVAAMGRMGGAAGTGAIAQLNAHAAADVADFDFTATQDLVADHSRAVTVHLDDVPFNGQDAVTLSPLADGTFANPAATSAVVPPRLGAVLATYTVGGQPMAVAPDAVGNIWVAQAASNSVAKLGPDGSVLGTFPVGRQPGALAVDSVGRVWVSDWGAQDVRLLSPAGASLQTFTLGALAGRLVVDRDDNAWVFDGAGKLYKLAADGRTLGTFATPSSSFLALDGRGQLWLPNSFGLGLQRFDLTGTSLGSVGQQRLPRAITADRQGHVWCIIVGPGPTPGLLVAPSDEAGGQLPAFTLPFSPASFVADERGRLWFPAKTGGFGLTVMTGDGRVLATTSLTTPVGEMAPDGQGHVWAVCPATGQVLEVQG